MFTIQKELRFVGALLLRKSLKINKADFLLHLYFCCGIILPQLGSERTLYIGF